MSRIVHLLPLGGMLKNLAAAETAKQAPKAKPKPKRGYSVETRSHGPTLLTDAQVIEARGLHEFQGWGPKRLAERFGTTPEYMQGLLRYATRSKLFPKPEDFGRLR